MTTREKRMLLIVGILGLGGLVLGLHQLVYKPLQQHKADQLKLQADLSEKQETLNRMYSGKKRLEIAKKRSLPADQDVAKREYEAAMGYILRSSGVPAGYTIVPKDAGDLRNIPELAPKKPAYSRIGYDIRMTKVDLPMIAKVLKAYYDLNLLHQITHIDMKRVEKEGSSGGIARRGADRMDLEVTLHTEAIILDGAEQRNTLTAVPTAVAAVAGQGGYLAVMNMPESSRALKPQQFVTVLAKDAANGTRDYLVIEARDYFHGPLPVVKPAEVNVEQPNVFKKAPPEDISPYIRLNALTTGATGNREAMIWDMANNYYYEVNVRDGDGFLEVQYLKKFRTGDKWTKMDYAKWQPVEKAAPFSLGEESTATYRAMKFVAFHEDGIVMIENAAELKPVEKEPKAVDPKAPEPKKGTARPQAGKDSAKEKSPPAKPTKEQQAAGAAVGGVAVLKPATVDHVYHWRIGQTLSALQPLSEWEAKSLLGKLSPKTASATEIAPVPRDASN